MAIRVTGEINLALLAKQTAPYLLKKIIERREGKPSSPAGGDRTRRRRR